MDEGLDLEGRRGAVGDVEVAGEGDVQDVVANGVADEHGVPPRRTTGARGGARAQSSEDATECAARPSGAAGHALRSVSGP
ncbi:hypothetical protein GCM10022244_60480 [Streptomyces gulbargensis]|uniref:Uncharacterized protein n=1 Tax=Streptomyces gulbargensis TaxID=364901 RepID=A0ABP7NEJ3_9ACTN